MIGVDDILKGMSFERRHIEVKASHVEGELYENGSDSPVPSNSGDDHMMIAGDVKVEIKPEPKPSVPTIPAVPQSSGIAKTVGTAVAGAALLAGGMGLNQLLTPDKPVTPAPNVEKPVPVVDTDTIGVLEPDK